MQTPGSRRFSLPLVSCLFFLSGATSLVYEVIWLRKLILIFGSTTFATSTILSTFMGGLALGAFLAGRRLDFRRHQPLRLYGILEILIGLYALLVPFLLNGLTPLYRRIWLAGGSEDFLLFSLVKFVGIAVVLLPPTVLMGASLPVMARQVTVDDRRIGGTVGRLYAINTFGAVAGTFAAGFLLIPGIGVWRSILGTAALNLVIGVVALRHARGLAEHLPEVQAVEEVPRSGRRGPIGVLLLAFALSGFGAMVLEVAWTRALALVMGSSVYAFALMLLAFLIGLASGSAFFAWRLKARPDLDAARLLVGLLGWAGVLAFLTAFTLQGLPRIFGEVYLRLSPGAHGWFVVQWLLSLIVMFPATFAFGGIFPAVLQLHARRLSRVSGSVGTVYASNTVGTILGAAVAGFWVIPALGVRSTVVMVACLEVGVALLVLFAFRASGRPVWRPAVLLVAALALFGLVRPGWNVFVMNSGVYWNLPGQPEGSDWTDFRNRMEGDNELLYVRDGLTASVVVGSEPELDNVYLAVNGKIEASLTGDMETQLLISHLPLLIHREPKDVMVIGLASGISVGAAATHPVESIKVVEVEEAMIEAAAFFKDHNGNILEDPRLELSINDARNELQFSDRAYDVIISEPSNPWMTVAANLFTEEFFEIASKRVADGGIFCQWVQTYSLPADDLRSILLAYRRAFRHVLVFETFNGVDLLLLGSQEPVRIDLPRLESRLSELQVVMDLSRVEIGSAADVLARFVLGDSGLNRIVEGAPTNTDDNARVEFSAPKALFKETFAANRAYLEGFFESPLDHLAQDLEDPLERAELQLQLGRAQLRRDYLEAAQTWADRTLEGPLADQARELAARIELRRQQL